MRCFSSYGVVEPHDATNRTGCQTVRSLRLCGRFSHVGKSDMQAALPHERLIQISGASIQARNCPQVWRPQRADARTVDAKEGARVPANRNLEPPQRDQGGLLLLYRWLGELTLCSNGCGTVRCLFGIE
jgi:hypothetical protein